MRHIAVKFILATMLFVAAGDLRAVDIVHSSGLVDAKARCESAGMATHIAPSETKKAYVVTCINPPPRLILRREASAAAVAKCVRLMMDAAVEVIGKEIRVYCIAR